MIERSGEYSTGDAPISILLNQIHSPNPSYRPDIDGLRALAVVLVVIYHAFPRLIPGGFIGVDIFFVISGFLITRIIVSSRDDDVVLRSFYQRRIKRIVPAMSAVVLMTLILGYVALLPHEYSQLGKHAAYSSILIPNFTFWIESGYFDIDSKLKPLLHLWSLGVEEQFYLVWPVLLLFMLRRGFSLKMWVFGLMALSFLSSLAFSGDRAATFFLPWYRAWELLVGAALALTAIKFSRGVNNCLSVLGVVVIVSTAFLFDGDNSAPWLFALPPTLAGAMLLISANASLVGEFLSTRALVFVGKISYSLYLWHWPALAFARILESGEPSSLVRCAAVAVGTVLAILCYLFVETPLRRREESWLPAALLLTLLSIGGAGFVIYSNDGLPGRFTMTEAAGQLYPIENAEATDCSKRLGVPGRCRSDGKPETIAVIGDSHSANLFLALEKYYADTDHGVLRLGRGGCPPLYGAVVRDSGNADKCSAGTSGNIDWIVSQENIVKVFLSSMGPMYVNSSKGRYRLNHPELEADATNAAVFEYGLEATVSKLLGAGKEVVLVLDWPWLTVHPESCVNVRPITLGNKELTSCEKPREDFVRRNARYREIVERVWSAHPGIGLWDTSEAFCNRDVCFGVKDGIPLYRDGGHLSLAGARRLGERVNIVTSRR